MARLEDIPQPTRDAVATAPALARATLVLGKATGVTLFDGAEGALVPTAFVAVTVNRYVTPFVRPVTVIGEPVPDRVIPPGLDVTV